MTPRGYRDAAGKAEPTHDADVPLRRVQWNDKAWTVYPHGFGRWACPGCGAWRWLACLTFSAREAVGEYVGAKEGNQPSLLRRCPRCEMTWLVELRTAVLA